jgi:predicted amidohydrolase
MTNSRLPIATAQSILTPDVRENGRQTRDLMRRAGQAGARLVHFPECALSGYSKAQVRDWKDVDWGSLREELEETADLARSLGLWTVLGCAHRLTDPNLPHNSLYVISDAGTLVGRYDKRRLSNTEISRWFTPGFEPLTFQVDGYFFGCAICIELCFPELFCEYERLGADCILFSSYSDSLMYGIMAQGHAAANCYWLSISVPAQCSFAVPASVIGPDGCYAGQASRERLPDLAFAVLDRNAPEFEVPLTKARPWRAAARSGEIYADRRAHDARSINRVEF